MTVSLTEINSVTGQESVLIKDGTFCLRSPSMCPDIYHHLDRISSNLPLPFSFASFDRHVFLLIPSTNIETLVCTASGKGARKDSWNLDFETIRNCFLIVFVGTSKGNVFRLEIVRKESSWKRRDFGILRSRPSIQISRSDNTIWEKSSRTEKRERSKSNVARL